MNTRIFILILLFVLFRAPIIFGQEQSKKEHLSFSERRKRALAHHAESKRKHAEKVIKNRDLEPPRRHRIRQNKDALHKSKWLPHRKCKESPRMAFRSEDKATRQYFANSLMIKATPSSLFDFHGPGLPLGVEYRFYRGYAVSVEGAIPLPYNLGISPSSNDTKGKTIISDIKFRADVRKYFNMHCKRRVFLGIEGFWRQQEFTQAHGYYDGGYSIYSYTWARAHKQSWGGGGMLGTSMKMGKHFFFEAYIGVGMRSINVEFENVTGLNRLGNSSGWGSLFSDEDDHKGDLTRPYFPIGIKISYMIR